MDKNQIINDLARRLEEAERAVAWVVAGAGGKVTVNEVIMMQDFELQVFDNERHDRIFIAKPKGS